MKVQSGLAKDNEHNSACLKRNKEERNKEEIGTFSCMERRKIGKRDYKLEGPTTFCFLRLIAKKGERSAFFFCYSIFTLVFKSFILIP